MTDLRLYQSRAVEWTLATWAKLRSEGRRTSVVVQLPTGGGKSRIIRALAPQLVIAPGVDLCAQLRETTGARVETTTLLASRLRRGEALPEAHRVAVDEARWVCAPGSSAVVEWYLSQGAEVALFDATPATAQGQGLGQWAEELLQAASVQELIAARHLVPWRVLGPAQPQDELAATPYEAWSQATPGETAIVFCRDKAHARTTAEDFQRHGVTAAVITDDTPPGLRRSMLAGLADGSIKVAVCAQILRQGIDVPRVSAIILARAVGSLPLYLQAVGRGGRPFEGKDCCTVLDLRGCAHAHGLPEDDRIWNLSGVAVRPAIEALPPCVRCKECLSWGRGGVCQICGAVLPPPPPPRVRAADLVDIRAARDSAEEKRATLVRYVEEAYRGAIARGKQGPEADRSAWAGAHRYEGTYRQKPARIDVLRAIAEARRVVGAQQTLINVGGQ